MNVCDVYMVIAVVGILFLVIYWTIKEMAWIEAEQMKIKRGSERFEAMLKLHEDEHGPVGPEGHYLTRRNK